MNNFLPYVNNFNLVIYCGAKEKELFDRYNFSKNIKLVIRELEDFYLYKYKDFFINNHHKNKLLRDKVDWRVNMLWCEKIYMVTHTIDNNYFDTPLLWLV